MADPNTAGVVPMDEKAVEGMFTSSNPDMLAEFARMHAARDEAVNAIPPGTPVAALMSYSPGSAPNNTPVHASPPSPGGPPPPPSPAPSVWPSFVNAYHQATPSPTQQRRATTMSLSSDQLLIVGGAIVAALALFVGYKIVSSNNSRATPTVAEGMRLSPDEWAEFMAHNAPVPTSAPGPA